MHTPAARMHHSPIHRHPHGRPNTHHTRAGTSPNYEVEVRATHALDTGPHRDVQDGGVRGGGRWKLVESVLDLLHCCPEAPGRSPH